MKTTSSGVIAAALVLSFGVWPALVGGQQPSASEAAIQRLLLEAGRREEEGDLAGALRDYELLVEQFPDSPEAAEALLRLARGRFRSGDAAGAAEAAQELVEQYRRTPQAAGAFVLLAELQAERASRPADLEEARATFRNVWVLFGRESYPELEWRAVARVRSGELALLQGAADEAAASFVVAMEDEAASEWTVRAALGLATVLLQRGEWVAAAETLQRVLNDAGGEGSAPGAAEAARRRLTLIHRLLLRPAMGEPRWQAAHLFQVPGVELKRPQGVAADEAGQVAVSDPKAPVVAVVDTTGRVVMRQPVEAQRPSWGPEGALYVPGADVLLQPMSRERHTFLEPGSDKEIPIKDLLAAEKGVYGDWVLLSGKPPRVLIYGPSGTYRETLLTGGGHEPVDLTRDAQQHLYVLDRDANSVLRLSDDGAAVRVLGEQWRRPEALAVDLLGNLYVLDSKESRVEVYSSQGRRLESVGPVLPGGIELRSPADLAVDGLGRLFIADSKLSAIVVLE